MVGAFDKDVAPGANPPATPAADKAGTDQASAYGITQNLINQFPELQKVYELFVAGNITDAKLAYYATDYYKKLNATSKTNQQLKANQPGVYDQTFNDFKIAQRKRLVAAGVRDVSDDTLQQAFDNGWSEGQLDLAALKGTKQPLGGSALGSADYVKQYANQFGMSYSPADYASWSSSIFSGETTLEDIKSKVRMDAKSSYPAYADQIDKGVNLDALASAYKNSISRVLEIDPDSVDYNNPHLRKALQYVGTDGKPATKPLWQFEKELRSSVEWQYTNNARDTMDSLSLKVLQDWGLA
jgi:hypothetical protein